MSRRDDITQFYRLLDQLDEKVGGKQQLGDCDGYMNWPDRGVYFFFATDEQRSDTDQLRLTRVGTHAVSENSGTSLWNRLRTHRGALSGSYEGGEGVIVVFTRVSHTRLSLNQTVSRT